MQKTYTAERLIESLHQSFPNYKITVDDLKKPHSVMGALFQMFERLDIDRGAILAPPPEEERTENVYFYWDLVPVINTIRVVNHLIQVMPQFTLTNTITQLLQPTITTSNSMLLLLYNLMIFREERMMDIGPYEEELFSKTDKVQKLKDEKNCLMELLNKQFAEKAERAGRLKNIDHEMKQYEEERKQENEAMDEVKQELEALQKENRQLDMMLEQKKTLRDAVMADVNKHRALRVYDADDIKAQVEQAEQNVQDAEEKLTALRATLMQKENSLKNLQSVKPSLDTANCLLYEITKNLHSLRDYESGDAEGKDCEQKELDAELNELQAQWAEVTAARADAGAKRQDYALRRQQERTRAHSDLREAEEKDKKCAEKSKRAAQRIVELQELTVQYDKDKAVAIEQLAGVKQNFVSELNSVNEAVLKKALEAKERIEAKISTRRG